MIKIEEQELAEINQLRSDLVDITYTIGQLAVQMHILSARNQVLTTTVTNLTAKEEELMKRLFDKYGVGSINYDTGEFISET